MDLRVRGRGKIVRFRMLKLAALEDRMLRSRRRPAFAAAVLLTPLSGAEAQKAVDRETERAASALAALSLLSQPPQPACGFPSPGRLGEGIVSD